MKEIRMVDLHSQYENIKDEINTAIAGVIEKTEFINGSDVKKFQQNLEQYLEVKHVIPCANGTDALQIALMALNLQPGDEIITTDFTFIATLEVIALLGLKPVIADVNPDNFTISVEAIRKSITPRTKVIMPVHLFGQCADMEAIMQLAGQLNIKIIEDAAQALGAKYTFSNGYSAHAGTMADFGTTSFFPSKNLGCYGDGGALFTNNEALAKLARSIANHGMQVRYYHDHIGINSRLDTIQAAILNTKLKYLNDYNEARQKAAAYYDKAFFDAKDITIPARSPYSSHIFHQYTLKVPESKRDALKTYLEEKNIPAMVYYPVPLHVQKAYEYLHYRHGDFPVTEQLCKSVISLPMHTEMTDSQLQYITESVLAFFA